METVSISHRGSLSLRRGTARHRCRAEAFSGQQVSRGRLRSTQPSPSFSMRRRAATRHHADEFFFARASHCRPHAGPEHMLKCPDGQPMWPPRLRTHRLSPPALRAAPSSGASGLVMGSCAGWVVAGVAPECARVGEVPGEWPDEGVWEVSQGPARACVTAVGDADVAATGQVAQGGGNHVSGAEPSPGRKVGRGELVAVEEAGGDGAGQERHHADAAGDDLPDATVVRCLLVPAAMSLAGRWNWWSPLDRGDSHTASLSAAPTLHD